MKSEGRNEICGIIQQVAQQLS